MTKKPQPLLSMPRADLEFSVQLKRRSGIPLYAQLASQLREAIRSGRLEAGSRVPSSRQLAKVLKVDRNMVVIAFESLLSEGYLTAQPGSGTFVTSERMTHETTANDEQRDSHRWAKSPRLEEQNKPSPRAKTITFALGQPSVSELDIGVWRSIWREVGRAVPLGDYADPQGYFELRVAIAQYLGRSRGLKCNAEDVVITNGSLQGAQLVARATLGSRDTIAFEEPGYSVARFALESLTRILPISVDDDGLIVDCLPTGKSAPLLVYCTPSHQYPLGSRLSLPRRHALLEWARGHDSLILEDDYDGEFRFETAPLPALAALGRDCTVYLGTFSKTIAPSLRVGYIVAPPALRVELVHFKALSDYHTSLPLQLALSRFIQDGHFERHIRRMRRVYGNKRQTLLEALIPIEHLAPLRGLEAGLHAHLELPASVPAQHVALQAEKVGVSVSTLEPYYLSRVTTNGLLLGYGGLTVQEIKIGAGKLSRIVLGQERIWRSG